MCIKYFISRFVVILFTSGPSPTEEPSYGWFIVLFLMIIIIHLFIIVCCWIRICSPDLEQTLDLLKDSWEEVEHPSIMFLLFLLLGCVRSRDRLDLVEVLDDSQFSGYVTLRCSVPVLGWARHLIGLVLELVVGVRASIGQILGILLLLLRRFQESFEFSFILLGLGFLVTYRDGCIGSCGNWDCLVFLVIAILLSQDLNASSSSLFLQE